MDHALKSGDQFYPVKYQQAIGDLINQRHEADFIEGLAKKAGTMTLVLSEKNSNGDPNIITFSSNQKRFLFDPHNQLVTFSEEFETGKKIINGEFKTNSKNGRHSIILHWDDEKKSISMMLDGEVFDEN